MFQGGRIPSDWLLWGWGIKLHVRAHGLEASEMVLCVTVTPQLRYVLFLKCRILRCNCSLASCSVEEASTWRHILRDLGLFSLGSF